MTDPEVTSYYSFQIVKYATPRAGVLSCPTCCKTFGGNKALKKHLRSKGKNGVTRSRCVKICTMKHCHDLLLRYFDTFQDGEDFIEDEGLDSIYNVRDSSAVKLRLTCRAKGTNLSDFDFTTYDCQD